ncbi:WYL domain-containing protein [Sorangium atrum]|uniref:WYL domain-containing protein n=1 Tax=Sorangium atrum TaxID=2995308 RepID=A0ABT5BTD9_9BACT|nr:WYL domain-containing protein [Sorangium aterium]MDC0677367.1 WYL domain-containing protein [Sorangium aterium]
MRTDSVRKERGGTWSRPPRACRRWYLLAYDLDRGALRTFRVDRTQGRPKAADGLPDDAGGR